MKKFKIIQMLCVLFIIALLISTIVYAVNLNKEIKAILSMDINVKYNGTVQTMKNSSDQIVYPIAYNGDTYLPVASICKMLDVPVKWDGPTRTIILGAEQKQPISVLKLKSKTSYHSAKVTDKESLKVVGELGAETLFNDGIFYDVWNGKASASLSDSYQAELNGLYSKLSFDAYGVTTSKGNCKYFMFYVYNVETKETICQIKTLPGQIRHVEDVDITGIKAIGFAAESGAYDTQGNAFFFNPIVK